MPLSDPSAATGDVVPAMVRADFPVGELDGRSERTARALFDLRAQPVDPALLEQVLEAGARPVVAVAVVALRGDDRLDDVADLARRHPSHGLREQRIGVVGPVVGHAHPAAGEHHVARQLAGRPLRERRHDADVVGVDVDAVVARPGDGDLELAWEVRRSVDRLHVVDRIEHVGPRFGRHGAFTVDPHLPVALGLWAEPGDHLGDEWLEHGASFRVGKRAGHHVAHHVATRRERGEQRGVDAGHELSQLALVDHVVLHALSCREPELLIGECRHAIEREPLLAGDHATGHRCPNHARVVEWQLQLGAGAADVAVVLLVDAVELQEQLGIVVEVVTIVDELVADRAAQVVAVEFDRLCRHWCNPHSVLSESAHRPAR